VVLAVERREAGEAAGRGVGRVVEPEADVEGVGRGQAGVGVEAEDLVEQDGLDGDLGRAVARGLDVRLVPRHAERLAGDEGRVGLAVRQLARVLDREQVEGQLRLEARQVEGHRVVRLAALDRGRHVGRLAGRLETVQVGAVHEERERRRLHLVSTADGHRRDRQRRDDRGRERQLPRAQTASELDGTHGGVAFRSPGPTDGPFRETRHPVRRPIPRSSKRV
jgi:hypothetical protein